MRLSRSVVAVTLSACLGYCAVLADASPSRHEVRQSRTSLAGLAGSLKTLVMGFATLTDVHWSMSGEVILMSGKAQIALPLIAPFPAIVSAKLAIPSPNSGDARSGDVVRKTR